MNFINDDFLLTTPSSRRLYDEYAVDQPIIDYHNHLSPQDIAENRKFENSHDMWIDHDHYKWRAMRAAGVEERLITGDASPKEKFFAFAAAVPRMLRSPLYDWTHLELKRFFDFHKLLDETTAEEAWDHCNQRISSDENLRPQGLLQHWNVRALCTTDDPADDLDYHRQIRDDKDFDVSVYPTFRPDWSLFVHRPEEYREWIQRLSSVAKQSISKLDDLLVALKKRHDDFHEMGCRLSDHGMEFVPSDFVSKGQAEVIFDRALDGHAATAEQHQQFSSFMLLEMARWDAERDWTQQFHSGVWRNNNTRLFNSVGRDIGCDSMGDTRQGRSLQKFLDELDQDDCLPKTVVYNLNPQDNYLICTMLGNFQQGPIIGKMQYGAGWWYLDQKEGIQWQLNTLSNTGLLANFIGMLTDSRSFLSFSRHEYFRRILCDVLGREMETGDIPNDFSLIGNLVSDICYGNAKRYLGLPSC